MLKQAGNTVVNFGNCKNSIWLDLTITAEKHWCRRVGKSQIVKGTESCQDCTIYSRLSAPWIILVWRSQCHIYTGEDWRKTIEDGKIMLNEWRRSKITCSYPVIRLSAKNMWLQFRKIFMKLNSISLVTYNSQMN